MNKTVRSYLRLVFGIVFMLLSFFEVIAQSEAPSLEPFELKVVVQEGKVSMSCAEKCAWKELNFTLKKDIPQKFDEYGMDDNSNPRQEGEPELIDVLMKLTWDGDEYKIESEKNTAWTDLTFSCNNMCSKLVTETGLTYAPPIKE